MRQPVPIADEMRALALRAKDAARTLGSAPTRLKD
jgi:hypothetical protein